MGAIIALARDVSLFPSGRDFVAWLGLTSRQNSTGSKARLGRTTKAGDRTLRTMLVLGDFSVSSGPASLRRRHRLG